MKKIFFVVMLAFFITKIQAQTATHLRTNNNNAWFVYSGDHKLNNHWGIHLEAQVRRNDIVSNWQQLLLRTGINYHVNNNVFFTAGYCFVETSPYGAFPVKAKYPENRFWEQMQVKTPLGKIEWVSRFRLEQRFSKTPVLNVYNSTYEPGDAVYTNRFRLLNRFSLPLCKKGIVDKSFYLSVFDEPFISFGKNVAANFFDQNRAYAGIGYKLPKWGRLELGYMEQTIYKSDGIKIENNHTLQLALFSNLDFFKHKS